MFALKPKWHSSHIQTNNYNLPPLDSGSTLMLEKKRYLYYISRFSLLYLFCLQGNRLCLGKISQEKIRSIFCVLKFYHFLRMAIWNLVYILHTDFDEFNFEAAANYFVETKIIWESSVPNAQHQNGLVKRLMQTTVEGAWA